MEEVKVKGSSKNKKYNFFTEWVVPVVIAAFIALLINKFVLFKVTVPTTSMVPTINVGDHIFVTRVYKFNKIESGDILVFDSKELDDKLIKRVIGLPGDNIVIKDGDVYRNGEKLEENYIGTPDDYNGEFTVPEGHYFFLGDNRAHSKDSRYFVNPYIPREDILGKAQLKIYPFKDFGWMK